MTAGRSRFALARQASRAQLKARVAIDGPTGSGKTWTALEWAFVLCDEGEKPIVIDTEHGSAEWYSDQFDPYATITWTPPYDPAELAATIKDAARLHPVVVVDSLSHFWEGEGGTMDIVDAAAQRESGGNRFAGWKVGTPALRHLVDTILGADAHVIATMRSKMEYVLEEDERTGKKKPVKLGMAPVMRQGVEYEFTLIADMDLEHRFIITKSRCSQVADLVADPNRAGDVARTFRAWLDSGEKPIGEADALRLAEALNSSSGPDRAAWRERFSCKPAALPEGRLQEANEFVAGLDQGGPDDPPPDGGGNGARPGEATDREAVEGTTEAGGAEQAPESEAAGDSSQPSPGPPNEDAAAGETVAAGAGAAGGGAVATAGAPADQHGLTPREVGIKAGHVFKADYDAAPNRQKTKTVDRLRHALAYACTKGAATSLNDCTPEQLLAVWQRLEDIGAGRLTYRWDNDPNKGVIFTSQTGKDTTVLWAQLEDAEGEEAAA
jgi:hypothetical protein